MSVCTGVIKKRISDKCGYILQDNGEGDLFVLPKQCVGFQERIPPVGCRVQFTIGVDPMKGNPLAENVEPEQSAEGSSDMNENAGNPYIPDAESSPAAAKTAEQQGNDSQVFTGVIKDDRGKHAFILQDNGEADMFLMPQSCTGFGGVCPPVGTRVVYEVVIDGKTGRPRAENIDSFEKLLLTGMIKKNSGKHGYILQDNGEPDVFVLPLQCTGFEGAIPPVGTRVQFIIGLDPKKHMPLAGHVEPVQSSQGSRQPQLVVPRSRSLNTAENFATNDSNQVPLCTGEIKKNGGSSGFIRQWNGEADVFVLPMQCSGFGKQIPPIGTPVQFIIGLDPQKGMPFAEHVEPLQSSNGLRTGEIKKNKGSSGFILQDNGEPDVFVLPMQCVGFYGEIPPIGTRVQFTVGVDPKKGMPLAEQVEPQQSRQPKRQWYDMHETQPHFKKLRQNGDTPTFNGASPRSASTWPTHTGQIKKSGGNSGFILRDDGEDDLFVLPKQCSGFGFQIPPYGTRVQFTIGVDPQKGRPLAENVEPDQALKRHAQGNVSQSGNGFEGASSNGLCTGVIKADKGKHGFIFQDSGESDMFFMPLQCAGFGGVCPPVGTRVKYEIVIDGKTGRPRAENIEPASEGVELEIVLATGEIKKNSGTCGYILQDSGEPDLFVLPRQCAAFGGELPPVGTRVQFTIGVDPMKGRPLAENVAPQENIEPQ